jgi:formamidopyrimidine-DNA glycosylase
MPEYPDVTVYIERLRALTENQVIEGARLKSPFLVRSFDPPFSVINGRTVTGYKRLGKRIIFVLDDEYFLVLHLMVAGRLRWRKRGASVPGRGGLLALDFASGTLLLTEVSKKKRASIHVVRGADQLAPFDRGGLEVLESSAQHFKDRFTAKRHTLKRALTDPRILSGIGNSYSDEILHHARLSPVRMTTALDDVELGRLYQSICAVLNEWTERLLAEVGDGFPEKVTAFRPEMAVHGKYKEACPVCETKVQRILYASRETNYCPRCQTDGKLLADRALSTLLKKDWPKTIDELEARLD